MGPPPAVDAGRRAGAAAAVRAGLRRPGRPPALAAVWVAAAFLLAATAYGCFQVPYVAQPAEITTTRASGDADVVAGGRLALGILLAGAGAPAVADAFGRRPRRLPGDGRASWRCCSPVGMLGAVAGTRNAPTLTRRAQRGRRSPATCGWPGASRPFRLLLIGFVVQALGIGVMLAGVPYYAVRVLHRPDAARCCSPRLSARRSSSCRSGARRPAARQAHRPADRVGAVRRAPRPRLALGRSGRTALVDRPRGARRRRLRRHADVPAVDAARRDRRRRGGVRRAPGRGVHRRLDGGRDARPGRRTRPAGRAARRWPATSRRPGTSRSQLGGVLAVRLGFSVLPGVLVLASLPVLARYRLDPALPEETAA